MGIEMVYPEPRKPTKKILAGKEPKTISGSEVETARASLYYSKYDKVVDGLVLKNFHYSNAQPEWAEYHLENVLSQWRKLKSINSRRRKEGKTIFSLPGTVRGYKNEDEKGILMTDLSEGGKYPVYDLKELEMMYLDKNDWSEIKKQIERDIAIAEEEGVGLESGPNHLDPWLITMHKERPTAYISDIGAYTSIDESKSQTARSTELLKKALNDIDKKYNLKTQ